MIVNVPNLITLLRILVTPLFVIFMIREQYPYALLVFAAAGVSDALDGFLARWYDQKTVLGAHLDPLADKLLLTSAYIALAVQQIIPSWLAVVVISRDFLILSGIGILRFFNIAFAIKPSIVSKCTTAAQLTTAFLVLLSFQVAAVQPLLKPIFWVTTGLTLASGLHYLARGVAILHAQDTDLER